MLNRINKNYSFYYYSLFLGKIIYSFYNENNFYLYSKQFKLIFINLLDVIFFNNKF